MIIASKKNVRSGQMNWLVIAPVLSLRPSRPHNVSATKWHITSHLYGDQWKMKIFNWVKAGSGVLSDEI